MELSLRFGQTIILGLIGGLMGSFINFPGSVLLGAMLFVGLSNFISPVKNFLPKKLTFWLQIATGALLGLQFTANNLIDIKVLFLPITFTVIATLVSTVLVMYLFITVFNWDTQTAFLSALPGRITEVIVLGEEQGANITNITSIHLARIITVTLFTPLVLYLASVLN